MTQEEKAKAYDEAVERAKSFIEYGDEHEKTIAESIFAGLIENKDERICNFIIDCIEEIRKCNPSNAEFNGNCTDAIAWLKDKMNTKIC